MWEGLIFWAHRQLRNITVLIDLNGLQGFGSTRDVASMHDLKSRIEGFGVQTVRVDGHDHEAIASAARTHPGAVILLDTVKGKGVSFMENRMEWHYLPHERGAVRRGAGRARIAVRDAFCNAMVELAAHQRYFFLTGDLGFMALEPLQKALGPRFINAGVAEQNMVSVAAGMAAVGGKSWVYSIAPFCYARPFEQIRNDVCLNRLPVRLVGNGGGYAYGSMGATHHALEDYGVLLTLPALRAYVPAFDADVAPMVRAIAERDAPAYLRLGRSDAGDESAVPPYAAWRRLQEGGAGVLVAVGPIAGGLWSAHARAAARGAAGPLGGERARGGLARRRAAAGLAR